MFGVAVARVTSSRLRTTTRTPVYRRLVAFAVRVMEPSVDSSAGAVNALKSNSPATRPSAATTLAADSAWSSSTRVSTLAGAVDATASVAMLRRV
ncbi:hypothetical protein D3C87_1623040 [compost metagenome]